MESDALDQFCGSKFWDSNLTWYTEDPDFTECFQKTVLIWIPCIFLWITFPFEIYHIISSRTKNIPWTWLFIVKFVLTAYLIAFSISELVKTMSDSSSGILVPDVDYWTPGIKTATFILALGMIVYNRKYGLRTSGLLWIFWLLSSVCGIVQYRRLLRSISDEVESSYELVIEMTYYPVVVLLFLLNFLADAEPKFSKYPPVKNPSPELKASFPSLITWNWFTSMIWKGYRRPLEFSDLSSIKHDFMTQEVVAHFDKYWYKNVQKLNEKQTLKALNGKSSSQMNINIEKRKTVSVLPPLLKAFGSSIIIGILLKIIQDILTYVNPLILEFLIGFTKDKDQPIWKGYFYAGLMLLIATIQTIVGCQVFNQMFIVGIKIRTSLIAVIYRKALSISNSAKKEFTVGEIVNLMAVDAQRFMDVMPMINMIWSAPFQILLASISLWRLLGPSVLAGLTVMIILIPINGCIANQMKKLQLKQMKYKDQRTKLMNEVLGGIKVLKLYAWEPSFEEQILKIREKEIQILRRTAYFEAFTSFIWSCAPFLTCLASFTCFVLVDENNILDSQTAFVSLSLFNLLKLPMSLLPIMLSGVVQVSVCAKRINKFLNSEDLNTDDVEHNKLGDKAMTVENGNFSWDSSENKELVLRDINLNIERGQLVAVVGTVGSGKSSLISALLGEMEKLSGRINIKGTIAYIPQQAWIQNATLRDNILFGKPFDKVLYNRVIAACALTQDFQMLPAGDQTEIGEKGINLSGGQKQRVSLARAVYHNSDIYLLDDPLSAVDSHVGKHIFDNLIGPQGVLKGKTRLLVTHGISFLPKMDNIIVLLDGEISESGTYTELLQKRGAFADFLIEHLQESDKPEETGIENLTEIKDELERTIGSEELHQKITQAKRKASSELSRTDSIRRSPTGSMQRQQSLVSQKSTGSLKSNGANEDIQHTIGERLIQTEKAETGSVKLEVYLHFLKSIGLILVFLTFLSSLSSQLCNLGSSIWLSVWSTGNDANNGTVDNSERNTYLAIYGSLGIGQGLGSSLTSLSLAFGCVMASKRIFRLLIENILRSPMSFFDTTPTGRILNRLGKDVDIIDNVVPQNLRQFISCFFQVIGTLSVISYSTPIFMTVILPLGIVYYLIQRFYVATSRQLKRLESVSRSPIYSHFSETVTGAQVIRAYEMQDRFVKESQNKVDFNQLCSYPNNVANRWLAIRLETAGNFLVFFAALFSVLGRETTNAGLVGLSVSYALVITQTLNWLVRMTSELETNIVAVERIKEYTETPKEAPWDVPETNPDKDWPTNGRVEFHNLDIRYREGLELVLKGLSLSVKGGEKVGIVGRTGAGKSSLTIALFRIVEAANGKIIIDGVDISKLGLHALRSRLTIIPQDPVLFSGTLRINLDPANKCSDDDLWRALEHAHLEEFVKTLPNGLWFQVSEGGENFSVGQRQLICLARALLRKTKVLILDEATAAVDLETDDLIQKTIREKFSDCTILTIAHRLNTILDSDRVVVLEKGSIVEYDSPNSLLQQRNGYFYSMAKDAGLT